MDKYRHRFTEKKLEQFEKNGQPCEPRNLVESYLLGNRKRNQRIPC